MDEMPIETSHIELSDEGDFWTVRGGPMNGSIVLKITWGDHVILPNPKGLCIPPPGECLPGRSCSVGIPVILS